MHLITRAFVVGAIVVASRDKYTLVTALANVLLHT
jgi:hypothetical protein